MPSHVLAAVVPQPGGLPWQGKSQGQQGALHAWGTQSGETMA